MSTPASESPRLPDREHRAASGDEPDVGLPDPVEFPSRIPEDEKDIRIPDPHE